jgi:hypothetical protein
MYALENPQETRKIMTDTEVSLCGVDEFGDRWWSLKARDSLRLHDVLD